MKILNPDHITIAVRDVDAAVDYFALLGFRRDHMTVIDGGVPADYMGMPDMVADHITLTLEGSDPHFEIQLLHFDDLAGETPRDDPTNHRRLGFNHIALRVDDLDEVAAHLYKNGVRPLNDVMDFIRRRLQFFAGPEDVTVELVEWTSDGSTEA